MTKEHPILFSGRLVRAILEGRKTETRRIARLTDSGHVKEPRGNRRWHPCDPGAVKACPFGQPGDRLWVRETWCGGQHGTSFLYRADWPEHDHGPRWRPSIHMPRRASRLTLEIVSRRLERLQDITEEGARAEGVSFVGDGGSRFGWLGMAASWCDDARQAFAVGWNTINGKRGPWESNPLVWVLRFRCVAGVS